MNTQFSAAPRHIQLINAAFLTAFAVLIIFAVEPWHAWQNADPNYYGWNLFSYFTVQSNIIAAVVYLLTAVAIIKQQARTRWFSYVRGAAVLYMLITGLVYTFLLQNNPEVHATLAFNWKNSVLHQIGPLFIITWWLLWPSRFAISARAAWWWLIFPVLWLLYTFTRAAFTGWYPYPFLDPTLVGGFGGVTLYVVGITLGFIALSQFVAWLSRVRASNVAIQ